MIFLKNNNNETTLPSGADAATELTRATNILLERNGGDLEGARLDSKILLATVLAIEVNDLEFIKNMKLGAQQREKFNSHIARRLRGEPISKIIGRRAFWNNFFMVDSRVLDPRPDSETLVEAVLKDFQEPSKIKGELKILDLGVGSGCLLLTLLGIFNRAKGLGVDIDPGALAVAKANSMSLEIENAEFILNNWNDGLEGAFDLVLSNPPYIKSGDIISLDDEVRFYDPKIALDGGEDGLACFRYIAANIKKNLTAESRIYIEVGQGQSEDVAEIFERNNFKLLRIEKDLRGISRVLVFR
jgi:release factor glutamine methyltransferase